MGKVAEKFKQKLTGAKNKVRGTAAKTTGKAKEGVSSSTTSTTKARTNQQSRRFEEGGPGTEIGRKDDPLTEYRDKEPMTPAKLKEHEPTAVRRDPTDQKITDEGQTGTDTEQANEQLRKRGITKLDSDSSNTS